jgi:hypothetical protein
MYRKATSLRDLRAYLDGAAVIAFDFEIAPDEAYETGNQRRCPARHHNQKN